MRIQYTNDPHLSNRPEVIFTFDMGDKEWSLATLKQIQLDLAEDDKIKEYSIKK